MRLSVVRTSVVLLQSRICQCFLYVYTSARLRYLANPRAPRPGTEPGCDSRRRAGTAMTRKVRNPVFRPSSTHHCTLAAGNDVLIDSLPPSLRHNRPPHRPSARIEKRHFHSLAIACRLRLIPKCSDYIGTGLSRAR